MALHPWVAFDPEPTVQIISVRLREAVLRTLSRYGAVVAVSGGIDSAVCAALAVRAFGTDRVLALLLPERESSPESLHQGKNLCEELGIRYEVEDITASLEAIGCYRRRDEAIRMVFPDYRSGWKSKIVISRASADTGRLSFFKLVLESPGGERMGSRLPLKAYLQIVAATSFKQRIRKTIEYFHADRLNYAVIGTPNRLEYDQGFFVKNGDGSADVKPIAHLFKTQVYELGRYLGVPGRICSAHPMTDTYTLQQSQEEFYFVLPYDKMDIALYGFNNGKTAEEVAREIDLTTEQVSGIFHDIRTKRKTTRPLHAKPILLEPVPEVEI